MGGQKAEVTTITTSTCEKTLTAFAADFFLSHLLQNTDQLCQMWGGLPHDLSPFSPTFLLLNSLSWIQPRKNQNRTLDTLIKCLTPNDTTQVSFFFWWICFIFLAKKGKKSCHLEWSLATSLVSLYMGHSCCSSCGGALSSLRWSRGVWGGYLLNLECELVLNWELFDWQHR